MSDPTAGLGGVIRPAPAAAAPSGEGQAEREQGFAAFFRRPDVISALTQFSAQLLQPIAPGQTAAGQVGLAIAQGGEAAGRAQAVEQERTTVAEQARQTERRTTAIESQAETAAARAETEAAAAAGTASRGERALDLQAQRQLAEQQFRQDRLAFDRDTQGALERFRLAELEIQRQQTALAGARNDIERQRIQTDIDERQKDRDAAAENLTSRLAVQFQIAGDQQAAGIITAIARAEVNNAVLTEQPVNIDKIVTTVRTALEAAGRLEAGAGGTSAPGAGTQPGNVSPLSAFNLDELTDEEKQAIFSNPDFERTARQVFGDERINQLRQQLGIGGQQTEPVPEATTP